MKQGVLGVLVLVQCAWAAVTWVLWLLADEDVLVCDLDEGVGAGGSVHDCAV